MHVSRAACSSAFYWSHKSQKLIIQDGLDIWMFMEISTCLLLQANPKVHFARLCPSNYASQLTFQSLAVPSHPADRSQYAVSAARLWVVLKC